MAYLDLTPMLGAMRERPQDFDLTWGGSLRHMPSCHLVSFDWRGNAVVAARCSCAMLTVSRQQSQELKEAMAAWKVLYWEPRVAQIMADQRARKINEEFAAHFRPSLLRRVWTRLFHRAARALPMSVAQPSTKPTPARAEQDLMPV